MAAEATEAIEAMGAWVDEGERSVAAINQKNELKTIDPLKSEHWSRSGSRRIKTILIAQDHFIVEPN